MSPCGRGLAGLPDEASAAPSIFQVEETCRSFSYANRLLQPLKASEVQRHNYDHDAAPTPVVMYAAPQAMSNGVPTASVTITGVDLNRDGLPDVLQR